MLKKKIAAQGKTMADFASDMDITYQHLSAINTGKYRPSWPLATKIGKALSISPTTIMKISQTGEER